MQEANRQRMVGLIRAAANNATIAEVVGTSIRTFQRTRNKWNEGEDVSHKSPGAPANKIWTNNLVEHMEKKIKDIPIKSMSKLAYEFGVSRRVIRCAAHADLNLTSFSRTQKHLLTTRQKDIRLERSNKLLTWLKHNSSTVKIFSDKKVFTLDMVFN